MLVFVFGISHEIIYIIKEKEKEETEKEQGEK